MDFVASDPSRTTESETLLMLTNDSNQDARSLAINLRRFLEKKIDFESTEEKLLVAELQKGLILSPNFSFRKTQEFQNSSTSAEQNEINPNQNETRI